MEFFNDAVKDQIKFQALSTDFGMYEVSEEENINSYLQN